MGLVLDSTVAITAERRGLPAEGLLELIREQVGSVPLAISVVSVMELNTESGEQIIRCGLRAASSFLKT